MDKDRLLYLFGKMRKLLKTKGKFQEKAEQIVQSIENSFFFDQNKVISVFFGDKYPPLFSLLTKNSNYVKNTFVFPKINEENIVFYHIESPNSLILNENNELIPSSDCFAIDNNLVDVILVPGEAFDNSYRRLDFDTHLYDRILTETDAVSVGVCLDCQIYRKLLPHDSSFAEVDGLLTEEGFYHIIEIEE